MTSSPLLERPVRVGAQVPRVFSAPPSVPTDAGDQAVALAAAAGLHLFPWQQHALRAMLGERADGKWAAFEAALLVPRQNGKGSVIEAYELANLFLFDAQLIIHSAHLFPTAQEAFRRLDGLIDGAPALKRQVHKVSNSHGSEGIELKSGARIRFMARTISGSGRGFSPDRLVLDEAFRLPPEAVAAMLPALSAQPNPQIMYTSSTGYPDSDVLWRLVQREWVVPRLLELQGTFPDLRVSVAASSAAEGLKSELEAVGIPVDVVSGRDVQAACGLFFDYASTARLAHLGQPALDSAVAAAKKRVEDGETAFVWGRKRSTADITPLYAVTLALWAVVAGSNMNLHPINNVW
jgi:hypothetical protein